MIGELLIFNCRIITPFQDIEDGYVTISKSKIVDIGYSLSISSQEGRNSIDAGGRVLVPGFLDVHIQGAGGCDILDGSKEALRTISKTCARFGVTGFLATTVFKRNQSNNHLRVAAESTGRNLGGAELLGIHIEGPFIAPEKRGMIQPDSISEPSLKALEEIFAITGEALRIMTIAPEKEGCLNIIEGLISKGVVASFGHSIATYEQTIKGIEAGITHITHLFNAMNPIHQRDPGPLPAIFENDSVSAQVIFDGVHIHPGVLRFTHKVLGPERIVLITDGMQAMGLPEGFYDYDGVKYKSRGGTAQYLDGTLIGTTLGMSSLVERFLRFSGGYLWEASRCASLNPATVLGIEKRKGSIEKGKDADLVILNPDLSVWKTIKGGEVIFEK